MPARYFFHLENGQDSIRDDDGVVAADDAEAVEQARVGIAEMRASGELSESFAVWTLVIMDDQGREVRRINVL